MSSSTVEGRLRRFMLALATFLFIGTPVELLFNEHFGEPLQLIPFVLCGLGAITAGLALFRPRRGTLLALRVTMVIVALGSLLGMYLHLSGNFEFELEIRPGAGLGDVLAEALSGANPLLAPGILAITAVIALAATYYHPALGRRSDS